MFRKFCSDILDFRTIAGVVSRTPGKPLGSAHEPLGSHEPPGRVEDRLSPALPHQTVRAIFPHTAFRCSSHRGVRRGRSGVEGGSAWFTEPCEGRCRRRERSDCWFLFSEWWCQDCDCLRTVASSGNWRRRIAAYRFVCLGGLESHLCTGGFPALDQAMAGSAV